MVRFILTMLFYGAFLAILVILCMWFFLGMSARQSIDWILQKTTEIVSVPKDKKFRTPGQASDAQLEAISNIIK